MKYRKKPVIIDAYPVELINALAKENFWVLPTAVIKWYDEGRVIFGAWLEESKERAIIINTLEGQHIGTNRDMLMIGVQGELYFCKKDIFIQTYELVEE